MSISFIADCHVWNFPKFGGTYVSGINARCNAALSSIAQAVAVANMHKSSELVICGDLVDHSDPEPQVLAALVDVLKQFRGTVHVLVGNHDQDSLSEGDHALGPLHMHPTQGECIFVHEMPTVVNTSAGRVLMAPFNPAPVREWLPDLLSEHQPQILAAHFGIIDADTPPFLASAPDAYSREDLFTHMHRVGVGTAVVGNWHNAGDWQDKRAMTIHQVGALTPTGFDNVGSRYGRVLTIKAPRSKGRSDWVAGPRFYSVPWHEDVGEEFKDIRGNYAYVRMTAPVEELAAAKSWLSAQDYVRAYDLLPDKKQATEKAHAASRAAAKSENMQESIAECVKTLKLAPGVRENVLQRVTRYLTK